MPRPFAATCLIVLAALLAACSAGLPPPLGGTPPPPPATALTTPTAFAAPPTGTPSAPAPTGPTAPAAPPALPPATPSPLSRVADSCKLLDSQNLAHLLTTAEINRTVRPPAQVDHAVFSTATPPAREYACIYYAYHQPGSIDMVLLQVSYWVDVPSDPADPGWAKAWADAAASGQSVAGIGDAAYTKDGRLTFKHGDAYITLEVLGNRLDPSTPAGAAEQLDIEKQLAQDALNRMP